MTTRRPYLPVVDGDIARVPLTQGQTALIDAIDAELVSPHYWRAFREPYINGYYAMTHVNRRQLRMHRLIMGALPGQQVDHANGDPLDNRRENLRLATHTQNARNRRRPDGEVASPYLGVHWDRGWRASIRIDGRKHFIGCFASEIEAARARDAYIQRRFPDDPFWTLNFPVGGDHA
jgi:HNH endonuclease